MPDIKVKGASGKIRTFRYEGARPSDQEIISWSNSADQLDNNEQKYINSNSEDIRKMESARRQYNAGSQIDSEDRRKLESSARQDAKNYGLDAVYDPRTKSVVRQKKPDYYKSLSEPASGTMMPLLAGSVLLPAAAGAYVGGAAEAVLLGAGASIRGAQVGGALGGALGGAGAGAVTAPLGERVASLTDPSGVVQIQQGRQALRQENPYLSTAVDTLPSFLLGRPGIGNKLNFGIGAGIGALSEGRNQLQEGKFDPLQLGFSSLLGGVAMGGNATRFGEALTGPAYHEGGNLPYRTDLMRAGRANPSSDLVPMGRSTSGKPAPTMKAIEGPTQWRTTSYGQRDANETTPDTNSVMLRKGAWENGLDKDSVAVSKDVELQFEQSNIKPHDWVEFTLSDGSKIVKRWDDRTAEAYKGRPLRGRIDLFTPAGKNPLDGKAIIGFTRVGKGKKLPLGSPSNISNSPSDNQTGSKPEPASGLVPVEDLANLANQGVSEPAKIPDVPTVPTPAFTGTARPDTQLAQTKLGGSEIERARSEFKVAPDEKVDGIAYTSDNSPVPYRWKVIDASELVTSHTSDMMPNPSYPEELQPRDRTGSATSINQVNKLAGDLNPIRLAGSTSAIDGAPIVGPDNLVESGNGRSLGIIKAYSDPGLKAQGTKYQEFVRDYAKNFLGVDTSGIKSPVLVRERAGQLTLPERAALAQRMNSGNVMQRTKGESAVFDADRLESGKALESYNLGQGLASTGNRGFVESFFRGLPPEELTGVFDDKTKTVSPDGERRILSALMASAFKNTPDGETIVKTVSNLSDGGIGKNLATSLIQASPDLAKLAYDQRGGRLSGDYDLTGALASAARSLASFKTRGEARSWIEQQKSGDLLGGQLTDPEQIGVMEILARDTYAGSGAKTTELLQNYAKLAHKTGTEKPLDGSTPDNKLQVLARADAMTRKVPYDAAEFNFALPETEPQDATTEALPAKTENLPESKTKDEIKPSAPSDSQTKNRSGMTRVEFPDPAIHGKMRTFVGIRNLNAENESFVAFDVKDHGISTELPNNSMAASLLKTKMERLGFKVFELTRDGKNLEPVTSDGSKGDLLPPTIGRYFEDLAAKQITEELKNTEGEKRVDWNHANGDAEWLSQKNAVGIPEAKPLPSEVTPKNAIKTGDQTFQSALKTGGIVLIGTDGLPETIEFPKLPAGSTDAATQDRENSALEFMESLREFVQEQKLPAKATSKIVDNIDKFEESVLEELSAISDVIDEKPARVDYERGQNGTEEYKDALESWKNDWANAKDDIVSVNQRLFDIARQVSIGVQTEAITKPSDSKTNITKNESASVVGLQKMSDIAFERFMQDVPNDIFKGYNMDSGMLTASVDDVKQITAEILRKYSTEPEGNGDYKGYNVLTKRESAIRNKDEIEGLANKVGISVAREIESKAKDWLAEATKASVAKSDIGKLTTATTPTVPEFPVPSAPVTPGKSIKAASDMMQPSLDLLTPEMIAAMKKKAQSGDMLSAAKERINKSLDKEDC